MNMREAKEAFSIAHFAYDDSFLEAARILENDLRNFERAIERLKNAGKTNRRRRTYSPKPSPEIGPEGPEIP